MTWCWFNYLFKLTHYRIFTLRALSIITWEITCSGGAGAGIRAYGGNYAGRAIMVVPLFTIKVRAGEQLMTRIRKVCQALEVKPANFIEYAIEHELERHESQAIREDITLEELRKGIMATGQSMEIHTGDEDQSACELCLTPIESPLKVEGPLLCGDCLELAQGPSMDGVGPPP